MLKELGMSSTPREKIPQIANVRWTWAFYVQNISGNSETEIQAAFSLQVDLGLPGKVDCFLCLLDGLGRLSGGFFVCFVFF